MPSNIAVIAGVTTANALTIRNSRSSRCKNVLASRELGTVEQKQEYASCVDMLYPVYTEQDKIWYKLEAVGLIVSVLILAIIIKKFFTNFVYDDWAYAFLFAMLFTVFATAIAFFVTWIFS